MNTQVMLFSGAVHDKENQRPNNSTFGLACDTSIESQIRKLSFEDEPSFGKTPSFKIKPQQIEQSHQKPKVFLNQGNGYFDSIMRTRDQNVMNQQFYRAQKTEGICPLGQKRKYWQEDFEQTRQVQKKVVQLESRNGPKEFPLYADSFVFKGVVFDNKDQDYDQDVDTDEESLHGSKRQCQDFYQAAMREYLAQPFSCRLLKNSEILSRI